MSGRLLWRVLCRDYASDTSARGDLPSFVDCLRSTLDRVRAQTRTLLTSRLTVEWAKS